MKHCHSTCHCNYQKVEDPDVCMKPDIYPCSFCHEEEPEIILLGDKATRAINMLNSRLKKAAGTMRIWARIGGIGTDQHTKLITEAECCEATVRLVKEGKV